MNRELPDKPSTVYVGLTNPDGVHPADPRGPWPPTKLAVTSVTTPNRTTFWTEYPVLLDGIGMSALRVPSNAPADKVLECLARLAAPKARFHP